MANPVASPDKITGGIVMIGSVFAITIISGFSDRLAKLLMIFMIGLLLLWAMSAAGGTQLTSWFGKIGAGQKAMTPL